MYCSSLFVLYFIFEIINQQYNRVVLWQCGLFVGEPGCCRYKSLPLTTAALLGNMRSNTDPEDNKSQVAPDFRRHYSYAVGKIDELKKR